MADVAQSAVTLLRSWTEGGTSGKEIACRRVTIVLSSQGSATNAIPASILFLQTIEQSTAAVLSDDSKIYPTCPNVAGSKLLVLDPTNATDANRANPADITGTITVVVKGQP